MSEYAPKFRVVCECGARQPRWSTAFTVEKWMQQHRCGQAAKR